MANYTEIIKDIKERMGSKKTLQIGKVYIVAPSEKPCNPCFKGVKLRTWWDSRHYGVTYGTKSWWYNLDEQLFDIAYNHKNAEPVIKRIISILANDPSIDAKCDPDSSKTWHQFTVEGKRFITDGYDVYCKWSYDAFKELCLKEEAHSRKWYPLFTEWDGLKEKLREDGESWNTSFTEWAINVANDRGHELNKFLLFYVWREERYVDEEEGVWIYDIGEESTAEMEYDEAQMLGKKVVERVLELRKKFTLY